MISLIELKLIGAVALVAALLVGYGWWEHRVEQRGYIRCQAEHAVADQAERARREASQAEINNETQRLAALDRAHAAALDAAAPGLRNALIAGSGVRINHPAPAASGATAADPGLVYADVLAEIEQRLRSLAATADERGTAGSACVGSYNALTK